ncbi:retron Eco8 family effector endonuclease [Malaciobacter canalis]|uniref:retron Eco8 family effector endonuclease n=1 Tax=Malaciobacter canalis TaxID=1912871 RepID=UPI00384BEF7A
MKNLLKLLIILIKSFNLMGIKSIEIKNLLSFDELNIPNLQDINCIVGVNNVGKSNLLKLLRFFYNKLENKKELPPELNNKYSSFGSITITYKISSRLKKRLKEKEEDNLFNDLEIFENESETSTFCLMLTINSNNSVYWSIKNYKILKIINYYYPFFEIEGRNVSLHNWDKLWDLISSLKSFNLSKLETILFKNDTLEENDTFKEYISYVKEIQSAIKTSPYSYKEKFLNYLKIQLTGSKFLNEDNILETQSDGTNAHKYIETFLTLLIVLTRRDYITPTIYIDEAEIGLHPKKNEELIDSLFQTYSRYNSNTPYPNIIFSTHSPNIVKQIIKLFDNQQIFHFYRNNEKEKYTRVSKLNSKLEEKFINVLSDNESRLFFSDFILFVEGETELEIFSNKKLHEKFPKLKRIDIYKSSSNVIGANINPSNIKASIPYLFLFDADKIYEFSKEKKHYKLHLKNKNKLLYTLPEGNVRKDRNFDNLISKYKKGFNSKYNQIYNNLVKIKNLNNMKFKSIAFTNNLEKENFNFMQKLLNSYLAMNNVRFVKTTIEETLINHNSKKIFFQWLVKKYNIRFDEILYQTKKSKNKIFCYKKRVDNYKIIYLNPRNSLKDHIYFKNRRRKRIDNLLIDYIRVIYFNGKFDNLKDSISKSKTLEEREKVFNTIKKQLKTSSIKLTEKQERAILKKLEIDEDTKIELILKSLVSKINNIGLKKHDKTSGWASDFLNFAIDKIEKSSKDNNEFNNNFKSNFRELYDIITKIEKQFFLDR